MKLRLLCLSTALLGACATAPVEPLITPPDAAMVPPPVPPATVEVSAIPDRNAELAALFEQYDQAQLAMSPIGKAYRGIVDGDYGKWDDVSDSAAAREQALDVATLQAMRAKFDRRLLSPQDRLSYDLFESVVARGTAAFRFRENRYLFDQMNGLQSFPAAFLINIHKVTDLATAEAYVSRLRTVDTMMDQALAESAERAATGVLPPKWVFAYVIDDARNLIEGAPFGPGEDSALWADFQSKVAALDIADSENQRLLGEARAALRNDVAPSYRRLIAEMERQQAMAPTDDGVWRLPNGAEYYAERLSNYTTTAMTPDQIHATGLREVERIHGEMRAIMAKVGFKGTLKDFFEFARTDPRFYAKSREEYLAKVDSVLDAMEARLPQYFSTLPKDPLRVKPVEEFREKSAGKAFYNSPAPDGSRPGTYYVNLYDLKAMSLNELEALAYHEGLPGHHLQRSIQTGLGDVPPFRRFGGVTAYTEGWGLYSEELGKDMGFYTDPYSDFGRLGMELWRAGRLVVDTGIHHKRWSREQAIAWLTENTPNPDGDIRKAIERYIVYPGQATAYMIGKLKIMELREQARAELGDRFDIRGFHDAVLLPGPVPLDILEKNVADWVARRKAG